MHPSISKIFEILLCNKIMIFSKENQQNVFHLINDIIENETIVLKVFPKIRSAFKLVKPYFSERRQLVSIVKDRIEVKSGLKYKKFWVSQRNLACSRFFIIYMNDFLMLNTTFSVLSFVRSSEHTYVFLITKCSFI